MFLDRPASHTPASSASTSSRRRFVCESVEKAGSAVVPLQADNLIVDQLENGDDVLTDLRDGRTLYLNRTALAVWESCDGRMTRDQVAMRLCDKYEVDFCEARKDVENIHQQRL